MMAFTAEFGAILEERDFGKSLAIVEEEGEVIFGAEGRRVV
jgi:hypothetical protein